MPGPRARVCDLGLGGEGSKDSEISTCPLTQASWGIFQKR